jgi:hypothetical protein
MKRKIIIAMLILIPVVALIVSVAVVKDRLSYSKCVGECENTELANRWLEKGEAYEVGVNSKGQPIFKNSEAAFEQAKIDYQLGFDYLYQYEHLPVLSEKPSVCNKYYIQAMQANPPMTVENYEIIKTQCIEITRFLGMYLRSFKPIEIS